MGAAPQHGGVRDVGDLSLRRLDRPARNGRWRLELSGLVVASVLKVLVLAPVTVVAPLAVMSLPAGQVVADVVCVFAVVAAFRSGTARALALAVGTGAAYGLVAVLVRDVATSLPQVPWASFVGLAAAFAVGARLIQLGYASGPADLVVAGRTVG